MSEHGTNPNQDAAGMVAQATGQQNQLPTELEAAWAEWSKGIQKVDERGMTLLRAAFEAGWECGASRSAAELGKIGGLKGGQARAASLSAERRVEIARNAAAKRWGGDSAT